MVDPSSTPVPRGRHAPPLDVRRERQRARLFAAAAAVFARVGYAEASAEAISREAGMSKATFYEHFANKEECILALFDAGAQGLAAAIDAAIGEVEDPGERVRAGIHAFLATLEAFPDQARTLLVEIIGAGPRAAARRDAILEGFADRIYEQNQLAHREHGAPRLASRQDAFALVGAMVELSARQLRRGDPPSTLDLEPVIMRVAGALLDRQPA